MIGSAPEYENMLTTEGCQDYWCTRVLGGCSVTTSTAQCCGIPE